MALYVNRPDRLLIPRWREFNITSKTSELSHPLTPQLQEKRKLSTHNAYTTWSKNKSILNSIALVNSAVMSNELALAIDAAKMIKESPDSKSAQLVHLCDIVLGCKENTDDFVSNNVDLGNIIRKIGSKINSRRNSLKKFPRNAIGWVDLAMWYTVLGKIEKAERAIKIAMDLQPTNPFVVRAVIRFYIHLENHEKMNEIYQNTRRNKFFDNNPRIMASSLTLGTILNDKGLSVKKAFRLIDDENYAPFETSDLKAVLATMEYHSGALKNSRRLFRKSLNNANENVVAQAEWANEQIGNLPIEIEHNSHEAKSYICFNKENWSESYEEAIDWLLDQPFSAEPASHSSYLASAILDDNEKAIQICNIGLRSNPKNFTLLNNKAYSLAVNNDAEQAYHTIQKINPADLSKIEKIVYDATMGAIQFQKGDIVAGEFYYSQAIGNAKEQRLSEMEVMAKIYKMRAETLCGVASYTPEDIEIAFSQEIKKLSIGNQKIFSNLKKRIL